MIVSDAFGHYLNHCRAERHVSAATLKKYNDCYTSWLSPWLGQLEVENINRLQILDMRQAMMNKPLSVDRQYSVMMCLKGLLKFCRGGLHLAALDPAEIKPPKRKAPDVQYLTNEEIQRMLNTIDTTPFTGIRLRALVELLLSTGMRISEALSLKREPFDMDQAEVEIIGKGKLKRHVFFTERCRYWIKQYLDKRFDDGPHLFVTTGYPARKLSKEDLSRYFSALRKKAGITKKLTPHLLRHTFCTNLLHNGADITHIKDLAGHQDIQTTARYYLGKDKRVLRQIVDNCLDYRSTTPGLPHSLEPILGPRANIHRQAFDENSRASHDDVPGLISAPLITNLLYMSKLTLEAIERLFEKQLTKEHFDEVVKQLASKDDLRALQEQMEWKMDEILLHINDAMADIEEGLAPEERLALIDEKLVRVEKILHTEL